MIDQVKHAAVDMQYAYYDLVESYKYCIQLLGLKRAIEQPPSLPTIGELFEGFETSFKLLSTGCNIPEYLTVMGHANSKLRVVSRLEENDKIVLLLGEAGAGKSQFLNLICAQALPDVFQRVTTNLTSRNDGYCFVRCKIKDKNHQEHNIVVMDTNAIPENQPEIIKCLAQKTLKERKIEIVSVVLLRKFSNNRNTSGYPHLHPIIDICGNRLEARTKTCLVLTHRKSPQDNPERYNACCNLFRAQFGADRPVFELQDNSSSAIQILQDVLQASGVDVDEGYWLEK